VTLSGPGGSGKTRLAIEVGHRIALDFHGGVFFVPLAAVVEGQLVIPAIAEAIGAQASHGDPLSAIKAHVRDNPTLILLDNLEHLVDAVAPIVADLITSCRQLRILATSRVPL